MISPRTDSRHITDSNSWPLHLRAFPELSQAAYSKDEVFSEDDIAEIVDYAGKVSRFNLSSPWTSLGGSEASR